MAKTFNSQLGNVKITDQGFERKKKGDWENILDHYPEEKIVDSAKYSEIEGLELEHGSIHPCIKVKISGEWKHLFFEATDPVEKILNRLKYKWQAWRQNH